MNRATLIGNLTRDPDVRTLQSGNTVCNFTLAVQRNFKNQSGTYDSDFINCVAYKHNADFASKYTHKGSKIAVEGAIQTRTYDDSNGNKRYVTEVIVDRLENLTPRQNTESKDTSEPKANAGFTEVDEDGLPF